MWWKTGKIGSYNKNGTLSIIGDVLDVIKVSGSISFHGIEKDLNVLLDKSTENNNISLTGKFIIYLSDFNVERPSLLLQKINNEIEIQINLIFN